MSAETVAPGTNTDKSSASNANFKECDQDPERLLQRNEIKLKMF